jgi:hypothetical protein
MTRRRRRDDDDVVVRDGEAVRVPMMLTDAQLAELPEWQRDVVLKWRARRAADAYGAYPARGGATEGGVPHESDDAIATTLPAIVVDAFGDSGEGLQRPGFRYLHAGLKSLDHAVRAVRTMERQQALADSIRDLGDSWKAGADREVARVSNTGDARMDAYADSVLDLTTAWRRR